MSESPNAIAESRATTFALVAIALGAFALRVAPLLHGAWPIDYDEGVYFSASALLVRGVLPYRDFVFVHPPGVLYALGIVSWFHDPARSFAAARILASIAGAISTFLAGRIALRAAGPVAAIAAAALYATFPEAVAVERGPFLETALNLACLAAANAWLRERPLRAGIAGGAACAVKLFGGIWIVAALLTSGRRAQFLIGAIVAGVALVAPLFLVAPRPFVEQVLLFQFSRPPDGIVSHAARLPEIFGGVHIVTAILAVVALVTIRERATRFFAIAMALTAAAFLSAPAYWSQYNSHLAASECVLAGIGAAVLLRGRTAAVIALLFAIPTLWISVRNSRGSDAIRASVPPNGSLFAFEPQWGLAAGRLPAHGDGAPTIVDSYAAMLIEAGTKFRDAGAAFQSPGPQTSIRARLAASRFAILGWRGPWQMNAATRAWFAAQFVCDTPSSGDLCLWEKFAATHPPAITFGDGWYAEEGTPPQSWRWMGARSEARLPAIGAPGRLELVLEIPRENLPATIAIALDGRMLDRFTTTKPNETRAYDVDGRATHLVITTTRTVSPPHDARKLGIRLNQLVWRPSRTT